MYLLTFIKAVSFVKCFAKFIHTGKAAGQKGFTGFWTNCMFLERA